MKHLLLVTVIVLITVSCTGVPEKSFVYKLDGIGQVACNRGEEKSVLQQTADALMVLAGIGKTAASGVMRGLENGQQEDMPIDDKLNILKDAFNACKKMNGLN